MDGSSPLAHIPLSSLPRRGRGFLYSLPVTLSPDYAFPLKLQTRAIDLFGPNYDRPVLKQPRYELGSVHFFSFCDFVPVLCFRRVQLSSNPFPEDENAFPAVAIVAFTRCTRGPCFDRSCPPSQRANNFQKGLGAEKETRTTLEILLAASCPLSASLLSALDQSVVLRDCRAGQKRQEEG